MKGHRFTLALAATFFALTATAATPAAAPKPEDGVLRITVPEVQEALAKGDAVLVDVRGDVIYGLEHIRGAISIPLGLIKERITDVPQGKLIVTYCGCKLDDMSVDGVLRLNQAGIERAAALKGGIDAWKKAGLPVDVAPAAPAEAPAPETATPAASARVRPPDAVTCDRSELTSYNGKVTLFLREKGKTTIRIATDWDTTESVTAEHPKYLILGEPMKDTDWKRKDIGAGHRANVWVCRAPGIDPVIDWRPGEQGSAAQ